MMPIRHLRAMRAIIVAASVALMLAACGFHLRGAANYTFSSIALNAPAAPGMAVELKRALEATGSAQVVDDPKKAQVILDVPLVADDKEVLSLSGGGSVREYLLIKRVSFRLHDADGNEWLPPGDITLRRSYTFNESEVLARDAQEQRLLKEMQTDAVYQLVRRLQAAKKPA
ncbi:MAG: LPS assembly lipoprotein LptE [Betaproteobacteria bacterium]|jgi:LPS-assembly lipoprotein